VREEGAAVLLLVGLSITEVGSSLVCDRRAQHVDVGFEVLAVSGVEGLALRARGGRAS